MAPRGCTMGWMSGLAAGLLCLAGCVTADVRTTARPDVDFGRYASAEVMHIALDETAVDLSRPLVEELDAAIRKRLEEHGYGVEEPGMADLRVEVRLEVEQVTRSTWDSDPDASASVLREFDEAVVRLRVMDRRAEDEIFGAEARSRLREPDPIIGPSAASVWRRVVDEAAASIPTRRPAE